MSGGKQDDDDDDDAMLDIKVVVGEDCICMGVPHVMYDGVRAIFEEECEKREREREGRGKGMVMMADE